MPKVTCRALALLCGLAAAACAGTRSARDTRTVEPVATTQATAAPAVADAAGSSNASASPWRSTLEREHPLVGRIVEVGGGRDVEAAALFDALATADVVVLGEQHDNPDHHLLQARAIEALVARGRRPAVVLEMIELAAQPRVDAALRQRGGQVAQADPGGAADALADALDWAGSGWPPFPLYRPIFVAALTHGLSLHAGSLDRARVMETARQGITALDAALVRAYGLDAPPTDATQQALRAEMQDAHCGMLPEAMLDPMVLVQRARDATLASRVGAALRADASGGAVLIAGNGHARRDRGVPSYLARAEAPPRVLVLALLEVRPGLQRVGDYADGDGAALPYDYVWFTPRVSDEDHCAALRERFEKTHAR